MNEFKRAREEYESTPIPEELDARVRAGIRQGGPAAVAAVIRWSADCRAAWPPVWLCCGGPECLPDFRGCGCGCTGAGRAVPGPDDPGL